MLKRSDLHHYQEHGVEFIKATKKCALFLDMGLGKTTTSLTAIKDLIESQQVKRVLIIAPLRVANTVWLQESRKWEHTKDLNIAIGTGGAKQRKLAMESDSDIIVLNREVIQNLVSEYHRKWPFDMVVIDESSSFKSSKTRRFKTLKKVSPLTNYMVLLTGTPSPNSLDDLWSQFFLIDNGERLGKTHDSFLDAYFTADYMGYKYSINPGADEKIHNKIKDITLRMDASDYLELPEKIELNQTVEFPADVKKFYKDFERDFIMTLNDKVIDVINAAAVANKLLQICNGAVYQEDGSYHSLHDEKISALKEILEDNPNETFLVAYNYRSDLERLQKAFPFAKTLDEAGKELVAWNKGETRLLLAHPASAGHGLNLQEGGNNLVWFGLNWSLELYQQFNARLHRQGQTKPVIITHLIAKGGIDEKVMKALELKHNTQKALLDFLKTELKA